MAQFLPPFEKAVKRIDNFKMCRGLDFPTRNGNHQKPLEQQIHGLRKFMLDAQKHSFLDSGGVFCNLYWATSKIVFEVIQNEF